MNKKILQLALPNIISNITIPLLGIVDMGLMGHLEDEKYIGAIALGGVIFNILYWGFAFLRMGTSGLTAQAYGAKDKNQQIKLLLLSLSIAIIFSIIAIILQAPVEWLSFRFINGSKETEFLAASYFRIRIYAAPATISLFAVTGWLIGMQNAIYPMVISIFINVVNIAFSYYFVVRQNLNSNGVALGTVIAQYMGLVLSIVLIKIKYGYIFKGIRIRKFIEWHLLKEFFQLNSDIFLRTICIIIVFTFFTSQSASTNDTILAVNSLLLQFLMFYSYFIDGFAYAAEALVGKYIGANSKEKLTKVIGNLFKWGALLALSFTLIYVLAGNRIIELLTNNPEIISSAQPFLPWVVLVPILGASSFIWDGIYIGATASKGMLYSMLASTFMVFFPIFFIFQAKMDNHALWLAMLAFLFSRGLFQTFLARRMVYKKI